MSVKHLLIGIVVCFSFSACEDDFNLDDLEDLSPATASWAWARSLQGPSEEDEIDAVAADQNGNVYISGKFEQNLMIEGVAVPLISQGMADIMLAKYSREGKLLWFKQFGGIGEDNIFDMDCDSQGNLLLSGYFQHTIAFDDLVLTAYGGLDMIVVKISPSGEVLWAKQFGGPLNDGGNEIEIGDADQIIVGAQSQGNFESIAGTGAQDAYVMSLTEDGDLNWIRAVKGTGIARSKAIEVDHLGNVYMGGDYTGSNYVEVDSSIMLFDTFGAVDAYLIRYSPDGVFQWLKTWGSAGNDICKGLVNDAENSIYLAGQFQGTLNLNNETINATNSRDVYLQKLDSAGNSIWLRHIKSAENLLGAELAINDKDELLFGIGVAGIVSLQDDVASFKQIADCGGNSCPLFVQYAKSGTLLTYLHLPQSEDARLGEIAVSGHTVFVDCAFTGSLNFRDTTFNSLDRSKDALLMAISLE